MVAAAVLSERLGVAAEPVAAPIRALLQRFGLPTTVPHRHDPARIVETMKRDKKRRGGKLVMVLLHAIGKPVVVGDVPEAAVRAVLEECRRQGD
jgi:3-dehydroquinate synthetase